MPSARPGRTRSAWQTGVQQPAVCRIGLQQDPAPQCGNLGDGSAMGAQCPVQAAPDRQVLTRPADRDESLQDLGCVVRPTVGVVGDQHDRSLVVDQQLSEPIGAGPQIDILHAGERGRRSQTTPHDPDPGTGSTDGQHRQRGGHSATAWPGNEHAAAGAAEIQDLRHCGVASEPDRHRRHHCGRQRPDA